MTTHFRPGVESLEGKDLLSGVALPTVTSQTYQAVSRGVIQAVTMLARSGDVERTETQLEILSERLPQGTQELLPRWLEELTGFDPNRRGSRIAMRNGLLRELDSHVLTGVKFGEFRFVGPGSARFENPASGIPPFLAGLTIANELNFEITVVLTPRGGSVEISNRFDLRSEQFAFVTPSDFRTDFKLLELAVLNQDGHPITPVEQIVSPIGGMIAVASMSPFPGQIELRLYRQSAFVDLIRNDHGSRIEARRQIA